LRDKPSFDQREEFMIHRRAFCKALATTPAVLATPALLRSAFADEVSSIVLVSQHGLPYLPLMVMDEFKLVEKHAGKLGVASLKPEYKTLGGTQSLIDALLSGQMNFGVTGVPGLNTLWDKTAGTPNEVRALSAVQSMPFMLVTNREAIKTIKDFNEHDKIALPAVKVSSQAICLQMAAAKEWGQDQYAKLDSLTITRPHPDAATSVMSKATEINSHYSVAPFYFYELATKGVHNVLKSYDTLGGPATNGVMIMAKKFRDANPKVTGAVYGALSEAEEFINKNPGEAAQIYIKTTKEKRSSQAEMTKFIADPDNIWTTTPQQTMTFANFMHKVGTMKRLPASWKDLYMPESHELKGA
jgi:NitT/TauT family transport system substrate-binding protein